MGNSLCEDFPFLSSLHGQGQSILQGQGCVTQGQSMCLADARAGLDPNIKRRPSPHIAGNRPY